VARCEVQVPSAVRCAKTTGTDRDAVWGMDTGGPKKVCVRRGTHWRHLANTTEPSMCGGDAAACQITLTICCYYNYEPRATVARHDNCPK